MKTLKIESCGNCPYLLVEGLEDIYYCKRMAGRELPNEADEIPDWCTLSDASQPVNTNSEGNYYECCGGLVTHRIWCNKKGNP